MSRSQLLMPVKLIGIGGIWMSSKSTFGATKSSFGAKKYCSKVFGDVGTFAPNLAPEYSINIFGARQHYLFSGRRRVGLGGDENFWGRGSHFSWGRGGVEGASLFWTVVLDDTHLLRK